MSLTDEHKKTAEFRVLHIPKDFFAKVKAHAKRTCYKPLSAWILEAMKEKYQREAAGNDE